MNNKSDNKSDIETYKLLAKKLKQLESKVISQLPIYTNETIDRNILEGEQIIDDDDIEGNTGGLLLSLSSAVVAVLSVVIFPISIPDTNRRYVLFAV